MKIRTNPSPNHDARGDAIIDMLVLHYTGMKSGEEALARLCEAESKVSAHYLVEEDGRVFQLVDEEWRAWHAGVSSWRGHTNINARSIGVEIVNPGHECGYRPFPEAQMEAVAALCQDIVARHAIELRNVVAHSDVAPARKTDPGELFDWAWLAEQGIGLFPAVEELSVLSPTVCRSQSERTNGSTAFAGSWQTISEGLEAYGYGVSSAAPEQLITAFQRHFRPEAVNGQWDEDCQARLDTLLSLIS